MDDIIFSRDGSKRNLEKDMLSFLIPRSQSGLYQVFEHNQYRFFETLGKDFSTYPLIHPLLYANLSSSVARLPLENRCYEAAELIWEANPHDLDIVFGVMDAYIDTIYYGTFLHAFLIHKKERFIIDPILVKKIVQGYKTVRNQNYFGVILSYHFMKKFLDSRTNYPGENTFGGYLIYEVFTNIQKTDDLIIQIQKSI